MKSRVLLVGAGQLGSRHLQGLARCALPLEVFVVEPNDEARARARARWLEVFAGQPDHEVGFAADWRGVPPAVDLVIVATSAAQRAGLVERLAGDFAVGAWVLEKVLAQSEEELASIERAAGGTSRSWVNIPRRSMTWYQALRAETRPRSPVSARVSGGGWGVACNAVHFLDLLAWWSGEPLQTVETAGLADQWFESKRAGYWEVGGTLEARYAGGSRLTLECAPAPAPLTVTLADAGGTWTIQEAAGQAVHSDGRSLAGRLQFQSELTGELARAILLEGRCALPDLASAADLHRRYLRPLQAHWAARMPPSGGRLPIT